MRQHLTWPHFHPPHNSVMAASPFSRPARRISTPRARRENSQVIKDKLAVAAVLLLVLATVTVFVLYLVQQAPHFGAGEFTGFATPAASAIQATPAAAGTSPASNSMAGLGRIPLILISTVVEMGIFVALGLYLRHDMNRKP